MGSDDGNLKLSAIALPKSMSPLSQQLCLPGPGFHPSVLLVRVVKGRAGGFRCYSLLSRVAITTDAMAQRYCSHKLVPSIA